MKVSFIDKAEKEFLKLDKPVQKQIKKFIEKIQALKDPRTRGKSLVGNLIGLWRYRVGDYRILCRIIDDELVIMVVEIGQRKGIYSS